MHMYCTIMYKICTLNVSWVLFCPPLFFSAKSNTFLNQRFFYCDGNSWRTKELFIPLQILFGLKC